MRRFAFAMVLALAARADAVETIQWNEAEQHVGETVTVEGRVLGIHCSPTSCLLAFDPTFGRFTAVVQAKDFKTFPPGTLEATFVGRKVRLTGKIVLLEKKPEIVLERPEDIHLVVTAQEKKDEKDGEQTAVLDRIDEMLDRVEALAERIENAQARLEQLSQVIDQRAAELLDLQAAANQPPPAPPEPSYGEAQPRPAYESLRTVKRGMMSNDVARLIGEPIAVEQGSEGASTWYYGYGRSIMFDRRGRATSLSGFPAP
jgi:hypothetical protein